MPTVALLAPVPIEHLRDAIAVCEAEGKVAFGSRAWEVFRELDAERHGAPVDVYIYPSGDPKSEKLEASWYGRYVGHVESKNGAHPEGMRLRPPSTAKYPADNKGHWAVFWELDQIRELPAIERISTGDFVGHKTGKQYKKNFVPEGPLIVGR